MAELIGKQCVVCNKEVKSPDPRTTTCSNNCTKYKKLQYMTNWHNTHKHHERVYMQTYTQTDKGQKRRIRRQEIQNIWGRIGGSGNRSVWKKAEELAVNAIRSEGFMNVSSINYFKHNLFDIRCEKDNTIHVFQVTTRTHIGDVLRHKKLANDLNLIFHVIYIKPDLSSYIIKTTGMHELNLTDLQNLKMIQME